MRKIQLSVAILAVFFVFYACKKANNSTPANARTVQNFSGTYSLTDLKASILGVTIDLYDSLPPCEQDNEIQLNANLMANFIDSGVKCVPPSDSTGVMEPFFKYRHYICGKQCKLYQFMGWYNPGIDRQPERRWIPGSGYYNIS